jgi:parvulin-like peptidyl-prolyl isomerase
VVNLFRLKVGRVTGFPNEEQSGFYPRYLEDFINALTVIENAGWTKELKERYLGSD